MPPLHEPMKAAEEEEEEVIEAVAEKTRVAPTETTDETTDETIEEEIEIAEMTETGSSAIATPRRTCETSTPMRPTCRPDCSDRQCRSCSRGTCGTKGRRSLLAVVGDQQQQQHSFSPEMLEILVVVESATRTGKVVDSLLVECDKVIEPLMISMTREEMIHGVIEATEVIVMVEKLGKEVEAVTEERLKMPQPLLLALQMLALRWWAAGETANENSLPSHRSKRTSDETCPW